MFSTEVIYGIIIGVSLYLAYLVYLSQRKNPYVIQPSFNMNENQKEMTMEELSKFDGKDGNPTYIALKNVVFDVSASPVYGPGGAYSVFAGKDCSVNLALMEMDEKYLNAYNSMKNTMSLDAHEALHSWYERLDAKYPKIGIIVDKDESKKNK